MIENFLMLLLSAVLSVVIIVTIQKTESVSLADESGEEQRQASAPLKFSTVFANQLPVIRDGQVLIQKHLYICAVDVAAKQPAWVAYKVSRADWDTENVLERNFSTPPELRDICLEQSDYESSGYDLGHLYGLQFVSASRYASEVNQLCAVAAQRPDLNRGPWLLAENRIRKASELRTVPVMAGQFWKASMPALKNADESHKVASHCWIIFGQGETEEAYLFPQDAAKDAKLEAFYVNPQELKKQISIEWLGESE